MTAEPEPVRCGLPGPVGPLSALLVDALAGGPRGLPGEATSLGNPLDDADLHLALYLCFELNYHGFAGVDSDWADEPSLLRVRRLLGEQFLAALTGNLGPLPDGADVPDRLEAIIAADDSPSIATYLLQHATEEQVRELLVHRSAYLLKEADPHVRVLPWLRGRPKAALVEILADEYGGGRAERMHAELYARCLRTLGMDWRENAYLDRLPGVTLATVNLTSLLCARPRWRGALLGHLAVTEMTSSEANRRYAAALRRLHLGQRDVIAYFDEHVLADAVHDVVAAHDMAGAFARAEPQLAESVLRGAQMLLHVEGAFARHVINSWAAGASSLRG
ncbi:MAG TPA: iron-containing redox enzyme family protein [Solirubrobacteraceae bacterium]|nr:iron-containing redox enzyme family protein [Solirubrobacteraceae bacterium]